MSQPWRAQVLRRGFWPHDDGGIREWALLRWDLNHTWPNEWVDMTVSPLHPYRPHHFQNGAAVYILHVGRWIDALVLHFWFGLHLVQVESVKVGPGQRPMTLWVGPSRIRPADAETVATIP